MDAIEFRLTHETLGDSTAVLPTLEPVVNGRPLRDLARAVERSAAAADGQPDLAGSYCGLADLREIRWPSRHYLGEPVLRWFGDGDTVLLGCRCGEWGCWPLTARVSVDPSRVHWTGIRTGHRDWDLSGLGPFTFDRDQYTAALEGTADGR